MRLLVALVGIPLGFLFIVYREKVKRFTGDIETFEKWFGSGGTYTGLFVVGLIIVIGSLMYALGTLQILFESIFGRFF